MEPPVPSTLSFKALSGATFFLPHHLGGMEEGERKDSECSLLPLVTFFLIVVNAHKPIPQVWKLSPAEAPRFLHSRLLGIPLVHGDYYLLSFPVT